MNNDELRIPVSVFQNAADKQPELHELTWRALALRLCRYSERPTKDGKAWSPVTYLPGTTRGKANVDQVFALVLDIDHGGEYWPLLEGREYLAHTTFQHTPASPRWRVTLPLSRPVAGADWPEFWLRANAFFGGCVDPQTKDSSRIFYLPSCPPGAQHEEKWQHGELLDPDSLPEVPKYEPPVLPRTGGPKVMTRALSEWATRFCVAKTDELAVMPPDSGRNAACNRLAYLLAGLVADPVHDLSQAWVEEQLFLACEQNGLVAEDGERSVRATIASGLESGLARPWSPADQQPVRDNVRAFVSREHRNGSTPASAGARLEVERMSEVKPEPIEWLWRNRLARGKATLLMGDPGLGKSLISHWLAARVSVGDAWPDEGACELGAAILFTIEDALADTVAPRLVAAGADRTRVVAVRGVVDLETSMDERMFALEEHVSLLEELIRREGANLVVMDPVTAYLGPNINAHKDTDVRRVLAPLQMMAERTGVALLLLMHLTKGSGVSALYRATGSIAFPAVCRVVLGVAPDPNDESGKRRLLLPVKFNIAPEATGIGYHIETTTQHILPTVDERDQPPIIVWDDEPVLVDATSAMDRSGTVQEKGALAECKRALLQIMSGGRILAREGERQLREAGAMPSKDTLTRAKRELGITSSNAGEKGGPWWWEPPVRVMSPRAHVYAPAHARNGTAGEPELSGNPDAGVTVVPEDAGVPGDPGDSGGSLRGRAREGWRDANEPGPEICPVHGVHMDLHDCDQL